MRVYGNLLAYSVATAPMAVVWLKRLKLTALTTTSAEFKADA
jgi:hypothetical protein